MICRLTELKSKEVINSSNGEKIGYADDVEFDSLTSCVKSVIVYGRPKLFGLFGKEEDVIIPWQSITLIGEDAILVENDVKYAQKKPKLFRKVR